MQDKSKESTRMTQRDTVKLVRYLDDPKIGAVEDSGGVKIYKYKAGYSDAILADILKVSITGVRHVRHNEYGPLIAPHGVRRVPFNGLTQGDGPTAKYNRQREREIAELRARIVEIEKVIAPLK